MKRKKIGDIIEFRVRGGVAYALYTHEHPEYGSLLRVWNRIHATGLADFEALIQNEPSFSCFFPLGAALSRGIVKAAGNVTVPKSLAAFPTFRTGMVEPDGSVKTWWLWDGTSFSNAGSLTKAQMKLPRRGIWNDTLIIERIEQGWTDATASN